MLEGTALIARQAAKKRAKENKKVVVHPVAMRYSFPFDVDAAAARMLDEIETRLTWRPSRELPLHERFKKVGAGLLALKELEYLGHTQDGTIAERIEKLIDAILGPMEAEWVNGNGDGHPVARVKRLRTAILPDMIKGDLDEAEKARRWRLLEDADLAQQLYHYPPGYVSEDGPDGPHHRDRRAVRGRPDGQGHGARAGRSDDHRRRRDRSEHRPRSPRRERPADGRDRKPVRDHARDSRGGHDADGPSLLGR